MPRIEYNFSIERSSTPQVKWYWVCKSSKGMTRFRSYLDYVTKGATVTCVRELIKKMKPGVAQLDDNWNERTEPQRKTV